MSRASESCMRTGKPRALVADDDPDTLNVVSEAVDQFGFDVTRAATGDELISELAAGSFELIITDVSMPWMTGLQAMHSARTAGLATPVVVITALRDDKVVEQVGALGHDATLLRKPFGIDELHAAIRTVLVTVPPLESIQTKSSSTRT